MAPLSYHVNSFKRGVSWILWTYVWSYFGNHSYNMNSTFSRLCCTFHYFSGGNGIEESYTAPFSCGSLLSLLPDVFYSLELLQHLLTISLMLDLPCSFFPTVLQPPIQAVGDAVYSCLVRMRLCRRPIRRYDVGAPSSIAISLPGMDPHDAERRRWERVKQFMGK